MFPLNTRVYVYSMRVTEHWNKWPREVVESPSLEIFKSHLEVTQGNLFLVVLLEQVIFRSVFQSQSNCDDSVFLFPRKAPSNSSLCYLC